MAGAAAGGDGAPPRGLSATQRLWRVMVWVTGGAGGRWGRRPTTGAGYEQTAGALAHAWRKLASQGVRELGKEARKIVSCWFP